MVDRGRTNPGGSGVVNGFQVELQALTDAADAVAGTLHAFGAPKTSGVNAPASAFGHDQLAAVVSTFYDRWNTGVDSLVGEGQQAVGRLVGSRDKYSTADTSWALIPGDPAAVQGVATHMQQHGTLLQEAGQGLGRIDTTNGWRGPGGDQFRDQFRRQPVQWNDGAQAFHAAVGALVNYGPTLTWAQGQAAEAIAMWKQGQAATEQGQGAARPGRAAGAAAGRGPIGGRAAGLARRRPVRRSRHSDSTGRAGVAHPRP